MQVEIENLAFEYEVRTDVRKDGRQNRKVEPFVSQDDCIIIAKFCHGHFCECYAYTTPLKSREGCVRVRLIPARRLFP